MRGGGRGASPRRGAKGAEALSCSRLTLARTALRTARQATTAGETAPSASIKRECAGLAAHEVVDTGVPALTCQPPMPTASALAWSRTCSKHSPALPQRPCPSRPQPAAACPPSSVGTTQRTAHTAIGEQHALKRCEQHLYCLCLFPACFPCFPPVFRLFSACFRLFPPVSACFCLFMPTLGSAVTKCAG